MLTFVKYLKDEELKRLMSVKNEVVGRCVRWYYRKLRRFHSQVELKELGFKLNLLEGEGMEFLKRWKRSYYKGVLDLSGLRGRCAEFLDKNVDLSYVEVLCIKFGCMLEDLSFLKGMKSLRVLDLSWVNGDWSVLKEMKGLRKLLLERCNISEDYLKFLKKVLKGCEIINNGDSI